jgi:DNA-binding transcriptional MerR regulator
VDEELLSIQEVSRISGVTSRALRYYDEIGIFKPDAQARNATRLYSKTNLVRLQRILLLREMNLSLDTIAEVMSGEKSDLLALQEQLTHLNSETERLKVLRRTIERTIDTLKGEIDMPTDEMFEGFANDPYAEEAEKNVAGAVCGKSSPPCFAYAR